MNVRRVLLAISFMPAALFAQAPAPRLEFEVASIKPSAPAAQGEANVGLRIDGAQVHVASLPLSEYVRIAFQVRGHQVSGPAWISTTRFDVDAKLPPGTSRDQVPDMLRALLEDRFHMKTHREERSYDVYAVSVGTGTVKLKQAKVDPETASGPGGPALNVAVQGSASGVHIDMGRGAYFSLLPDRLEVRKLSMSSLAGLFERFMDRPVIDATGLTGTYDFDAPLTPEDYRALLIQTALNNGVTLPPQAMSLLRGGSNESLSGAMRAAGLKLESRKAPLDTVVVDSVLQSPSEN
jgi:uncharacterized protein (TIGR03435 family)